MNSDDDIVDELCHAIMADRYPWDVTVYKRAIDEIERLRQEVQNLSDISDGWWQFHIGKISPEEMGALLQKADATAKRPIPGYYDADKRQNEEAN